MDVRHEKCDAIFEASMNGCVTTLKALIEKDPLILNKTSLTSFGETPLHVSALLGHLDFTKVLLDQKPQLTKELDSRKRSPLHLASAKGHKDIVKALLDANKDANFLSDQDGRIPLHYAAMRGQVDVVRELISTTQAVVLVLDGEDRSVLHLCVKYNHLEVLKLLVDRCVHENEWFLNLKDRESDNTILHLAVMLKKIKTVEYLVSIPKVNARNQDVVKRALEILEHSPKYFKSLRIQNIFASTGAEREQIQDNLAAHVKLWCINIIRWFGSLGYEGNWAEDMRGSLMVVATVVTTMTFQPSVSPPGGVSKDGTSVLAKDSPLLYLLFIVLNTTSFIASLSVVFLLISGFPLKSKFIMFILTSLMFTSLTFTTLTYVFVIFTVIPFEHNKSIYMDVFYGVVVLVWIGLVALVIGFHLFRLLTLLLKNRQRILKYLKALRKSIRKYCLKKPPPNRDVHIEDGR